MSNTSKTSKSLGLMAALVALLSSASPGMAAGPTPVNLGSADSFVILSKSGITDVPESTIVGDIGTSPINGAAIGVTCAEVVGTIYAVDATGPACSVADATLLTTAVGDMETAYDDAAGRTLPDATELGAGNINGMTLAPGLYKWGTGVQIPTVVTLKGGPNDVWIFQIAGNLTVGPGAQVVLAGGAQANNIFWQVAGDTLLDTTASFKGTILCKTLIAMNTGAVLSGRALAQTAVTLQMNAVTAPDYTKKECEGFLKAEKTAFDNGQKADKKLFDATQKTDKQNWQIEYPRPTSAQKTEFANGQKAEKQSFDAAQKTDKQVFAAEQKIDMQECNTLQ